MKPQLNADNKKVLIAMSGGMDSWVATALLKTAGYEVAGIHFQLSDLQQEEFFVGQCHRASNQAAAERAASKLGIPFFAVDGRGLYQDAVEDYIIHEVIQNRVPNPCIQCTNRVLFKLLVDKANEMGFPFIGTGHYAQVSKSDVKGLPNVSKAVDAQADQSQFLYGLDRNILTRLILPLGGLTRKVAEKLVREFGFESPGTKHASGRCFQRNEKTHEALEKRIPLAFRPKGIIRLPNGQVAGEHEGLFRYSIGDPVEVRHGLSGDASLFVIAFDENSQSLIAGNEKQLIQSHFIASESNWIRPVDGLHSIVCQAQIGLNGEAVGCEVVLFENRTVHVHFEKPQRALAPGQPIVFYEDQELLGGAIIEGAGSDLGDVEKK